MEFVSSRYPSDLKTFTHSGLTGAWNRERAGQRMRLKEPNTWEQLLSREGNKSATWEKLIGMRRNASLQTVALTKLHAQTCRQTCRASPKDSSCANLQFSIRFMMQQFGPPGWNPSCFADSKSLPFMAMLRNLRNLIIKGISEAHHKKILSRLTNQVRRFVSERLQFISYI